MLSSGDGRDLAQYREQAAADLRAKREAGANLRRDFAEAGHWEELARARGLRLPHWHQPCTQRYMAHWLNRLGIPTAAYLEWAGERSLRVFAQQNPDWGLRAWVGLLLEAIEAGAFSGGASASFRPFPAQDRIA